MIDLLQILFVTIAIGVALYQLLVNWKSLSPAERRKRVEACIYSLVLEAEREFGSKTGDAKYASVVKLFYTTLPKSITRWVTVDKLTLLIDTAVGRMETYFKSNPTAKENILK
jgi:hypothetical protein